MRQRYSVCYVGKLGMDWMMTFPADPIGVVDYFEKEGCRVVCLVPIPPSLETPTEGPAPWVQ